MFVGWYICCPNGVVKSVKKTILFLLKSPQISANGRLILIFYIYRRIHLHLFFVAVFFRSSFQKKHSFNNNGLIDKNKFA